MNEQVFQMLLWILGGTGTLLVGLYFAIARTMLKVLIELGKMKEDVKEMKAQVNDIPRLKNGMSITFKRLDKLENED